MQDVQSEVCAICDKLGYDFKRIPESAIRSMAIPFICELCSIEATWQLVHELKMKDHYTYRHCIGVAILSFGIGTWLGMDGDSLQELAIAGFLHDVGKINIHNSILKKAGPLTKDEYGEMCLHTLIGFDMLRHIEGLTEQQALVALQHHERENGSGYPFGIEGVKITQLSKVVAVADVVHTMTSERVYKRPLPLYQALREIYEIAAELFDAKVVYCFVSNMMKRAIGSRVLLSNGQIGRIVKLHEDNLIYPVVKSRGRLYDIRKSKIGIIDFTGGIRNVRSV